MCCRWQLFREEGWLSKKTGGRAWGAVTRTHKLSHIGLEKKEIPGEGRVCFVLERGGVCENFNSGRGMVTS